MTEEDKNFKYIIALSITVIGFLAYIIYIKSKEGQIQPATLSMNTLSNVDSEQIYNILQKQHKQLNEINAELQSNKERLEYMINTKNTNPIIDKITIPKSETKKAGNVENLRENNNDVIRRLRFNMA